MIDDKEYTKAVEKGFSFIKNDSVFILLNIPRKKLISAITSYANDASPSDVLLLYDDTLFGSAKDGFLITKDRFYSKEQFQSPKALSIESIEDVSVGGNIMNRSILINGIERFSSAVLDKQSFLGISLILKELSALKNNNNNSRKNQHIDDDELM